MISTIAKAVACAAALCVFAAVLTFALMPTPYVQDLGIFPSALAYLFDANDFWRNVAGGAALQVAVLVTSYIWNNRLPVEVRSVVTASIGVLFFSLAETAQIFIPRRTFDWMDIGAGALGVLAVSTGFYAGSFTLRWRYRK